jgi:hypothetical protein
VDRRLELGRWVLYVTAAPLGKRGCLPAEIVGYEDDGRLRLRVWASDNGGSDWATATTPSGAALQTDIYFLWRSLLVMALFSLGLITYRAVKMPRETSTGHEHALRRIGCHRWVLTSWRPSHSLFSPVPGTPSYRWNRWRSRNSPLLFALYFGRKQTPLGNR